MERHKVSSMSKKLFFKVPLEGESDSCYSAYATAPAQRARRSAWVEVPPLSPTLCSQQQEPCSLLQAYLVYSSSKLQLSCETTLGSKGNTRSARRMLRRGDSNKEGYV